MTPTAIIHPRSYVGMFDYGDVIAYILLVLQNMPPPGEDEEVPQTFQGENLTFEIKDIVRRALQGEEIPVKLASGNKLFSVCVCAALMIVCLDLSQKNPFYSILPEATLLSAVEEFAYGTHRGIVYK